MWQIDAGVAPAGGAQVRLQARPLAAGVLTLTGIEWALNGAALGRRLFTPRPPRRRGAPKCAPGPPAASAPSMLKELSGLLSQDAESRAWSHGKPASTNDRSERPCQHPLINSAVMIAVYISSHRGTP